MTRPRDDTGQQWRVLEALMFKLAPFGQTASAVSDVLDKCSTSGVRTRLKELTDMGLVEANKPEGSKHMLYFGTQLGYSVLAAKEDGVNALNIMRNTHVVLEAQRAAELAPIKEKWQRIIENQMHMIAGSMVR